MLIDRTGRKVGVAAGRVESGVPSLLPAVDFRVRGSAVMLGVITAVLATTAAAVAVAAASAVVGCACLVVCEKRCNYHVV